MRVQAQEVLDGANGFGIPFLLGVEGGQEEAGFPVFRVQGDDAFVFPGGLLQLVQAHVQAGQEKICLLLLGIQPEGFLGVSQGLLHIALALVEGGQLHLQEGGFGIIG